MPRAIAGVVFFFLCLGVLGPFWAVLSVEAAVGRVHPDGFGQSAQKSAEIIPLADRRDRGGFANDRSKRVGEFRRNDFRRNKERAKHHGSRLRNAARHNRP
jgi:hypothetical protein